MTQVPTVAAAAPWRPRTGVEVLRQQLEAIERFGRSRCAAPSTDAGPLTREGRLDAARERDVLERQHEALVAHVHRQLAESGASFRSVVRRRAVLAHRSPWFAAKVCAGLEADGVHVVALLENGADAVGVAVAEQPDLVLVEDALPMVPGPRVVAEVRALCPAAVVAAQVDHGDRLAPLLDAGATVAFVRRQPPGEVVDALLGLLRPLA